MTQPYSCPDCKDTGIYQGLLAVEPCRACGGRKDTGTTLYGKPVVEVPGMANAPDFVYGKARYVADVRQQFQDVFNASPTEWTVTYTYTTEPPKPLDEILPAELKGLAVGRTVHVEVHCNNWTRIFEVVDRFVDRPLFGLPPKSFRITSFASKPKEEGCEPSITGTLLYKPISDDDKFILKNSAGEFISEQWMYASDPCQDMLFTPIVED